MANVSSQFQTKKPQFNRNLSRTIIFVLLLLTIIPVGLIGGITYFRSTSLIKDQTTSQLINTGNAIGSQVEQYAQAKTNAIANLAKDPNFVTYVRIIQNPDTPPNELAFYKERISDSFETLINNSQNNSPFNQAFLMDNQGTVIYASKALWNNINLFDTPSVRQAINTNQPVSYLVYDLDKIYPNDLISLSVSPVSRGEGETPIYLTGIAVDTLPSQIFETVENYYPDAKAFYQLKNDLLLSRDPSTNRYDSTILSIDQQAEIKNINPNNIKRKTLSLENKSYFLYEYPLKGLNSSLLITCLCICLTMIHKFREPLRNLNCLIPVKFRWKTCEVFFKR